MFSSTLRKEKKEISKSREIIFEPTCIDLSETRSSTSLASQATTNTLQRKCKTLARKFIKSVSHPIRSKSNKNQDKSKVDQVSGAGTVKEKHHYEAVKIFTEKFLKGDDSPTSSNLPRLPEDDAWKKWQDLSDTIDKNISDNFTIRRRFRGDITEGCLKKQKYYFIEGYGLVSEKSLLEFKDLQSIMVGKSKNFKSNLPRSKSLVNLKSEEETDKLAPKKRNNFEEAINLKKELDTLALDRPVPKPRTIFRSKSVTFVEVVGTKDDPEEDVQVCPNCRSCYKQQEPATNKNYCNKINSDYRNKTKSLERTRGLRNQAQHTTLSNTNRDPQRRHTVCDLSQSRMYTSEEDDLDQIYRTEIELEKEYLKEGRINDSMFNSHTRNIKLSDENIYQNTIDISKVLPKKEITKSANGNLDKTESIVYRNPFYRPLSIVRNSNIKNYDIKMYESKLKMDFLVDTNSVSNKPCAFKRSQSMRVNMDQAEAIMCQNHYYDLLSHVKKNT